jgi:hypothetical protein
LIGQSKNNLKKMGKKTKKVKKKIVTFKKEIYSQKYEKLYNNEKYSDFEISFEGNENKIKSHKNILATSSEFFSKLIEENQNSVKIQEDVTAFKQLIEFYYTGTFNCIKVEKTIDFLLLAIKVSLNTKKVQNQRFIRVQGTRKGVFIRSNKLRREKSKRLDQL